MINTLKNLFLIQNTYRSNGVLFYLRKFPIVGKFIPYSWHKSPSWKTIFAILNVQYEIIMVFVYKLLYLFLIFSLATFIGELEFVNIEQSQIILNLIFFGTLAGGIANCFVIEPKKEINYALIHLRMDAKKVVFSSLTQFLLSSFVGFSIIYFLLPFTNELGVISIVSLLVILICCKLVGGAVKIYARTKRSKLKLLSYSYIESALGILVFAIGVGISLVNLSVNTIFLAVIAILYLILAILAIKYISKFPNFLKLYKDMFSMMDDIKTNKPNSKRISRTAAEKYIEVSKEYDSKKTGYAFLNELFIKRHRKLLSKTTINIILIEICLVIMAIIASLIFTDFSKLINESVVNLLPITTYFLYFFNCGERTVRVLFTNCDSKMLTFRFYKKPRAILEMFTLRLKTLVLMDWGQNLPIALGLPVLLYITGGTQNPFEYVVLFMSIMSLSMFFCIHNLVIYYVFQPFNKDLEVKNPIYTVIKAVTYFVCFFAMQSNPPAFIFGVSVTIFSILYVIISIPIAYKVAPNTFKIKE